MTGKARFLMPFEIRTLTCQKSQNLKSTKKWLHLPISFIEARIIYSGKTLLAHGDSINSEAPLGQEHGSREIHMYTTWAPSNIKAKTYALDSTISMIP